MECSEMRAAAGGFKGQGVGIGPCKMHTRRPGARRNGALRLDVAAARPNGCGVKARHPLPQGGRLICPISGGS
ncbi:hypothetical protein J2T05_003023 [Cupriavidus necator]|nr:hypothetical protein [Cupriavidus necator]